MAIGSKPAEVGELDKDRGIYMGIDRGTGMHAYAAPDFMRNETGEILILSFKAAEEELAKRNQKKAHKPGQLVLPSARFLIEMRKMLRKETPGFGQIRSALGAYKGQ